MDGGDERLTLIRTTRNERKPAPETIAPTKPHVEFIVAEEAEPPFRVIIHNDEVTTMEFVVEVLRQIFELAPDEAEEVMLTAHYTGLAVVGTFPQSDAMRRVTQAHLNAQLAGFPLRFTIEPEA
jgi:ATP-dependent Clp protease adaptor protein ClpS